MSEHKITVESGTSVRLPTAGKYCDRDILITAEPGESSAEEITVFTNLEDAQAAASEAGEIGSGSTYYFGQKVIVDDGETVTWFIIQRPGVLEEERGGIESISLLIEVDGVTYALDNASGPDEADEETVYAVEINT